MGGVIMATTSFGKQFYMSKEKSKEFMKDMKKPTKPTLTKDFKTQLKQGKDAKLFLQNIV